MVRLARSSRPRLAGSWPSGSPRAPRGSASLRQVGKQAQQAHQHPVAVDRRVPVEAAVERGVHGPRLLDVRRGGPDLARLVRILALQALEGQARRPTPARRSSSSPPSRSVAPTLAAPAETASTGLAGARPGYRGQGPRPDTFVSSVKSPGAAGGGSCLRLRAVLASYQHPFAAAASFARPALNCRIADFV